ncbi:hypothetical protein, partial [Acinetobacter sp. YH16031]|uniref:hypothetical protein n=1 Tax=Acinetobacter sp. YH16031 TaxID=2601180 RepID=UPI00211E1A11
VELQLFIELLKSFKKACISASLMSYLFTKEQGILKDQKKGLMMKKHLIFLVFIVMVFILALVVKINNDHKKRQALNKLELVEKQIH